MLRRGLPIAAVVLALGCPAAWAGTPIGDGGCTVESTGAGDSCQFIAGANTLGYTGDTNTGWSVSHMEGNTRVIDDSGGQGNFTKGGNVLRAGITYTLHVDGLAWGLAGIDPNAAAGAPVESKASAIRSYDPCAVTSWTAGTVDYCDGVLQYHDYVDDDYGANDGSSPSPAWGQTGTQRYAVGDEGSADIAGVDLWIAGNRLHVRFELAALYRADQTVAALAIDTDNDPATGGGAWGTLGVTSRGWDTLATFDTGDVASKTIEGDLPLPGGDRWRIQALTARRGGPVMNVAFRGPDEAGAWFEDNQAKALATGDISAFGAAVDVDDLRRHTTREAPDPQIGKHERVYTSAYTIGRGQGYDYTGIPGRAGGAPILAQTYQFYGRLQPYGVYIPPGASTYKLNLWLHPLSGIMTPAPYGGMASTMGDAQHRILMTPLARGQNGFYVDYAERDVLDALDDLERAYPIDPETVLVSGYSMGGYGALRMAALYPDRFAGYMNWVGYTGDASNGMHPLGDQGPNAPAYWGTGGIGNIPDLAGNLRYVPGASLYGAEDELVHFSSTEGGLRPALEAAKVPFAFYMHPAGEHFTFAVVGGWQKETAYTRDLRLVHDPPRVTYRTARFIDADALGIRHDRAYWVSRIVPADRRRWADVDLTTHACGGALPVVTEDLPGAGPSPIPWYSHSASVSGQQPIAVEPKLTGSLRGITSLTIDADRACLAGRAITVDVTSDLPVRVTLTDGRTVDVPGGASTSTLLPAPHQGASATDPTGTASVSADVNTEYQTYRRDQPEVRACDRRAGGYGELYVSPSGSGPSDPQQGSSFAGQSATCSSQTG